MSDSATYGDVVRIDIWSDVVCPWCYIGKRRFDEAVSRLKTDVDDLAHTLDIRYRAYQLDPTAPVGNPSPVRDVYARKFGGPERADAIFEQMTATAAAEGIRFDFARAVRPNTTQAHRLLWWTYRGYGYSGQSALEEALMAGYFTHGLDLGDLDTLADIAVDTLATGLDTDKIAVDVRAFLSSETGVEDVRADIDEASAQGITGVPTYVIDGQWAIPGAQDSDTFERVVRRALQRRDDETAR